MIGIMIGIWQAIHGDTTMSALGQDVFHLGSDLLKRNAVSFILKRDGESSIQKGH